MTGTEKALRASFERYGARGPSERGDYQLNCPFCEDREGKVDEKFKLSANPTVAHPTEPGLRGGWVCWRCDARGWGGLDFLEVPDLKEPADFDLGPPFGFVPFRGNERSLALEPYRQHVRARGGMHLLEALYMVGAGGCLSGRFEGRVIVPYVEGGKWVGFSARAIGRQEPKYLYPKGMDRRAALWGLEWVPPPDIRPDLPLFVVEGVFDALPLFPYGVATFGKSVTPQQIERLAKLDRVLVVALDGDAWMEGMALATRIAMRRAAWGIEHKVRWVRLPPATDPGQLGWGIKQYLQDNG